MPVCVIAFLLVGLHILVLLRSDVVEVFECHRFVKKHSCLVYKACECHVGTKPADLDRQPRSTVSVIAIELHAIK